MRPTEAANLRFGRAARLGLALKDTMMKDPRDPIAQAAVLVGLGEAIAELALGMEEMSKGLRATYILIEQTQTGSGR